MTVMHMTILLRVLPHPLRSSRQPAFNIDQLNKPIGGYCTLETLQLNVERKSISVYISSAETNGAMKRTVFPPFTTCSWCLCCPASSQPAQRLFIRRQATPFTDIS
ncbi:hypothetical protein DAPPUDRAFT_234076 [Daphnia pulex]|uniref:Uncharacterized protein n=1 Tax=Daphnia pulex TaxID=6669 RepID=E9FUI2_DAPPU|nr:hypothetical protein DAPPUDRAFT_234076 [Daphnia pulex]|eukprot:EFX88734.1 hypothetical protein DAPPUDRAFT_234076 [Daphnia pulex]